MNSLLLVQSQKASIRDLISVSVHLLTYPQVRLQPYSRDGQEAEHGDGRVEVGRGEFREKATVSGNDAQKQSGPHQSNFLKWRTLMRAL